MISNFRVEIRGQKHGTTRRGAWADSLQNSNIKGQPYLTDQTRHAAQAGREREEFFKQLRKIQDERKPRMNDA